MKRNTLLLTLGLLLISILISSSLLASQTDIKDMENYREDLVELRNKVANLDEVTWENNFLKAAKEMEENSEIATSSFFKSISNYKGNRDELIHIFDKMIQDTSNNGIYYMALTNFGRHNLCNNWATHRSSSKHITNCFINIVFSILTLGEESQSSIDNY